MKNLISTIAIFFMFGVIISDAYKPDDVYDSLPQREKFHFLRYYLMKGLVETESRDTIAYQRNNFPNDLMIPDSLVKTFEHIQMEPPNFHQKLFERFMREYGMSRSAASRALTRSCSYCGEPPEKFICVGNQCIDLGDVGSICCT